ncbi:MAG: hypothetical protein HY028_01360 [Gammaproteobacteria bacterium]|nr:hypothetical protein [Gammaproteobacteria bacterium]
MASLWVPMAFVRYTMLGTKNAIVNARPVSAQSATRGTGTNGASSTMDVDGAAVPSGWSLVEDVVNLQLNHDIALLESGAVFGTSPQKSLPHS